MKTRKQIHKRMSKIEQQFAKMREQYKQLQIEDMLLCDKVQHYKEEERTIGRGKSKETILEGRIYFKEDFVDGDTGNIITIERSRQVRVNGEWVDYYTPNKPQS